MSFKVKLATSFVNLTDKIAAAADAVNYVAVCKLGEALVAKVSAAYDRAGKRGLLAERLQFVTDQTREEAAEMYLTAEEIEEEANNELRALGLPSYDGR